MEIKPTYVTFEQAQWLKEKGFKIECSHYYMENNSTKLEVAFNRIKDWDFNFANEYTIPCKSISAPEQCKVVEWLWSKYKLWIYVIRDGGWFIPNITDSSDEDGQGSVEVAIKGLVCFDTPEEAYNAAFDYVLNNNLI